MRVVLKDLVPIGKIHKSIGRAGDLHAEVDGFYKGLSDKLEYFILLIAGDPVPFFVQNISEQAEQWQIHFEEVDDPQEAKKLIAHTLYVEQDTLPAKKKKKHPESTELLDWLVLDNTTGAPIGRIKDIQAFPSQTMLIIHTSANTEKLIPFVEEWVNSVWPKKKTMSMDLPPGLLDLQNE